MSHAFRLLETGENSAFFNMGLDEAILESVSTGESLPTLRFYAWRPKAISIGYFQGINDEVDSDACSRSGVDIVRRITGGGAVFHDMELTYSIVFPESHALASASILESYRLLCRGVIEGLAGLGVDSEFAPINDILSRGRKVSGNAQTRKMKCILQHGTVLLGVDVETMFGLLKVPKEKSLGKLIEEVKSRVTSISDILGRETGYAEALPAMIKGFSTALDLDLTPGRPSAVETARANELAETKFSAREWIYRR
jgi:lipoate-protein ligase A